MARVFGMTGPFGSGKTTTAVIKALQWATASGTKIFANFPMRGAYHFDSYSDWYRIADLHGSVVIFDESQTNFDSRKWANEANTTLTQIFNYVRKMNCVFIFILPSYNNIDTRIRQNTELLINCQKTPGGTIINHVYDYQDKAYGEWGRLLNKWVLPSSSQKKVYSLDVFDTNSMVKSFPMPEGKKQTKEFFEELDRRHEAALKRLGIYKKIETLDKEGLTIYAS
ncbi:zonular occludens toxin domain-containing protein [Paenibacillus sp. NPDC058367]|uniref:zonular occludens toxin domain-containing protein n=1 Tax=Paenibacillus sp. NPDC058367 TaxID=3346460 RepID=UPI003657F5D3